MKRYFRWFLFIFFFLLLSGTRTVFAGSIDVVDYLAKIYHDGTEISFRTTNGSPVSVTDTALTGDLWGEETGWINLSPTNGGVKNSCSGQLSGFAWGEGTGWINFGPFTNNSAQSVQINTTTGEFNGFAWSQNFGWIQFDCSVTGACVKTDWTPSPSCTNPGGGGGGGGGPTCATDPSLCPTEPIDMCPDIPGIQTSLSECPPIGPTCLTDPSLCSGGPIDMCPDIPGIQTSLSECPLVIGPTCATDPSLCTTGPGGGGGTTTPPTLPTNPINPINPSTPLATLLSGFLAILGSALLLAPFAVSEGLLLPSRISSLFLLLLGFRKHMWGVVYDSVTRQPLDPVYLVLKDHDGKDIAMAITDLNGRYGFLVPNGLYSIVANRTNYIFPSKILAGKTSDQVYDDLYFGEEIKISGDNEVIVKNIPMDPSNTTVDWNEMAKRNAHLVTIPKTKINRIFSEILNVLFWLGFTFSAIIAFISPTIANLAVLVFYLAMYLISENKKKVRNPYGSVLDKSTGLPLALGVVHVFSVATKTEVSKKTIDSRGTYYCLLANGEYYMTIDRRNDDGTYTPTYTSEPFFVRRGYINKTVQV